MIAEIEIENSLSQAAQALLFSDEVSAEIVEMIERVGPSVVQVQSGGRGIGAGVIWRSDGGIITNYHVVAGGRGPVRVALRDGRSFDAKVVNSNPTLDLALLQVDAKDLPAALVADSTQLRVAELVFAVGHPWGHLNVVTAGIISSVGEIPIRGTNRTAQYLRSDVQLGPGNSGGPLLDAQGAVVGVNAMIFGGDLAIAIPSHVASEWVAGQPSRKVYLGVGIQPVELPSQDRAGLMVVAIEPDGPAHRAGLHIGDVLLAVSGQSLDGPDTLSDVLARSATHDNRVRLQLMRAGATRELEVELSTPESSA
jgi:serine protease Do